MEGFKRLPLRSKGKLYSVDVGTDHTLADVRQRLIPEQLDEWQLPAKNGQFAFEVDGFIKSMKQECNVNALELVKKGVNVELVSMHDEIPQHISLPSPLPVGVGSVSMMQHSLYDSEESSIGQDYPSDAQDTHHAPNRAKETSHQVLNRLSQILAENPDFCSQAQKNEWLEAIGRLSHTCLPKSVIGVLGGTGVGKSSLINALLDESAVLSTSGSRGCTATVVELIFHWGLMEKANDDQTISVYKGEIEFMSYEDLTKELKVLLEECSEEKNHVDAWTQKEASRKRIELIYGKGVLQNYHKEASDMVFQVLSKTTNGQLLSKITEPGGKPITLKDWKKELKVLVEDCSTKEKLVDHRDAAEAWQKLETIFGNEFMEQLRLRPPDLVFRELANNARIKTLLTPAGPGREYNLIHVQAGKVVPGSDAANELLKEHSGMNQTTRAEKGRWAAEFGQAINSYIYGNEGQPQTWPLIRQVRLLGPWPVLSTGAVLVDLPGVRDSNEARAKVAEKKLQDCNQIAIVAPIKRAVNDKTVHELIDEQIKRRLLMDGQLGGQWDGQCKSIFFICTFADDIEPTETMHDHPLTAQLVPGRWEKMLQIKRDIISLEAEINEKFQQQYPKSRVVETLTKKCGRLQMKLKQLSAEVRNEYSMFYIQENFRVDLKALHDARDEIREDTLIDLSGDLGIDVFCTSANDYLKLKKIKSLRDGPPITFTNTAQTQIPLLQEFVHRIAVPCRHSSAKLLVEHTHNLLDQVKLLAADSQNVPRSLIDTALNDLGNNIGTIARDFQKIMDEQVKQELAPVLQTGAQKASAIAQRTVESWGSTSLRNKRQRNPEDKNGLPWPTYRAVARRNGIFTSTKLGAINLNQELCDPMEEEYSIAWDCVLNYVLPSFLCRAKEKILRLCADITKSFAHSLCDEGIADAQLTSMLNVAARSAATNVKTIFQQIGSIGEKTQRELSRELSHFVQSKMEPVYQSVIDVEYGEGLFQRMTEAMVSNSEQALSGVLFHEARKNVIEGIENLVKNLKHMLESTAGILRESYTNVFLRDDGQPRDAISPKMEEKARVCRCLMLPELNNLVELIGGACEMLEISRANCPQKSVSPTACKKTAETSSDTFLGATGTAESARDSSKLTSMVTMESRANANSSERTATSNSRMAKAPGLEMKECRKRKTGGEIVAGRDEPYGEATAESFENGNDPSSAELDASSGSSAPRAKATAQPPTGGDVRRSRRPKKNTEAFVAWPSKRGSGVADGDRRFLSGRGAV